MNGVSFDKYSSNGNHFVLLEETADAPLTQAQRSDWARRAADAAYGVGADSVIFLRPLKQARAPAPAVPEWAAHFFEPSGDEFLTCGNGLACIARHIYARHGQMRAQVLVEQPAPQPVWSDVSWQSERQTAAVQLKPLMPRIRDFVEPSFPVLELGGLLLFGACHLTAQTPLLLASGVLVYTGEPHMVLLQYPGGSPPPAWPASLVWAMDAPDDLFDEATHIERAGRHVNYRLRGCFPRGMNLAIARPGPTVDTLEYRCFERGLETETLACGTGALAVGLAALQLGVTNAQPLRLLPSAARRHPCFKDAELRVSIGSHGLMTLTTRAEHVFAGVFSMTERERGR